MTRPRVRLMLVSMLLACVACAPAHRQVQTAALHTGAATAPYGERERRLEVQVAVLDPTAHGHFDDFAGGRWAAYHLTRVVIRAPEAFAGNTLDILHAERPDGDAIWVRAGAVFWIELEGSALREPGVQLPAEGIRVLEIEGPADDS